MSSSVRMSFSAGEKPKDSAHPVTRWNRAMRSTIRRVVHRLRRKKRFSIYWRVGRYLQRNSFEQGVNLVGYTRAEMGLGQAARGLALAMEAQEIPFQILNVKLGNTSRHDDLSWAHKEANTAPYDITVVVVNPDNIASVARKLSKAVFRDRYTIAYWFWELPEIPNEWFHAFSFVDEVWAASRFIQDAVALKSHVPVFRVPVPVQLELHSGMSRSYFGLPERRFLFLNAFDTHSVLRRKNPFGAISAFKKAFSQNDGSVGLVLKVNNAGTFPDELNDLRAQMAGHSNIYFIDEILTRHELTALIAVTDCFVSLHRSEGYGLAPAEAMSLGKPVILTNWSGNTDYMSPDNSAAVDYDLVPVGEDLGPYSRDQMWAEPKLGQAADLMRRLVTDADYAAALGKAARVTIKERCSPRVVGTTIEQRLKYIRSRMYSSAPR